MKTYFKQFISEVKNYSVIIEDDGKVAYAYLLRDEQIVADVWLYNQQDSPREIKWIESEMPFLNPIPYIKDNMFMPEPICNDNEVGIIWHNQKVIEADIYIRGNLLAILKEACKPSFSSLVKIDGPLAKTLPSVERKDAAI